MTATRQDISPMAADIADRIHALVIGVSPDGSLLFTNRMFRDRLGYDMVDMNNKSMCDVMAPAYGARCSRIIESLFSGQEVGNVQTKLVARDGTTVDVEGPVTQMLLLDGTVAALGMFVEPVGKSPVDAHAMQPFVVPDRVIVLTTRQKAVLQLFASGCTTKQVATELNIAVKTVHNHLTTIYRLLDAQSLVQATMIAAQLGLVELAAPMH